MTYDTHAPLAAAINRAARFSRGLVPLRVRPVLFVSFDSDRSVVVSFSALLIPDNKGFSRSRCSTDKFDNARVSKKDIVSSRV